MTVKLKNGYEKRYIILDEENVPPVADLFMTGVTPEIGMGLLEGTVTEQGGEPIQSVLIEWDV